MSSSLHTRIIDHLHAYLSGSISLAELRDWFAPVLWSIESSHDPAAESLAYAIELRHSEYVRGHGTEDELRHALASLTKENSRSGHNPTS